MVWKATIVAAALASIAAPVLAGGADEEFDEKLSSIAKLIRSQDYEQADALVDALLTEWDPTQGEGQERVFCAHTVAETLLYPALVAKDGASARVLGPDYCDALFYKSYLHNELGRAEQARALLERLRELAPMYPQYAAELAFALRPTGDHERMLANYQSVIDGAELLEADESIAHYKALALRGRGWVYADMKRWDEAEAALKESLEYEPDNAMALGELRYVASERAK